MQRIALIRRRVYPQVTPRQSFRPRCEILEDRSVPSTLTVTSSDDSMQPHTLRYEVAQAQSGDTILVTKAVKTPIVLTLGELSLTQNITIKTAGNNQATISGDGLSRVFEVTAGAKGVPRDS